MEGLMRSQLEAPALARASTGQQARLSSATSRLKQPDSLLYDNAIRNGIVQMVSYVDKWQ
jgi:hypothetical protein